MEKWEASERSCRVRVYAWSMGTQQGACPQWIEELDVSNIVKLVGVMHCPWWNGTKREEDGFPGLLEVPYSPGGVHNLSLWRRANPAPRNTTVFGFFNTVGHRNAFRQMDLRVILESAVLRAASLIFVVWTVCSIEQVSVFEAMQIDRACGSNARYFRKRDIEISEN